jgi:hypothetical protein
MQRIIFFLLLVSAIFFSSQVYAAIPQHEREALIGLYNKGGGRSWNDNSGWKTPPLHSDGFAMPGTEGNWYGIHVTQDHVVSIDMYKNNLWLYSLPSSLFSLEYLTKLNLCRNEIYMEIPPEIGNLAELRSLDLGSNQFYGTIPPELGKLSKLSQLKLLDNDLSGSIPPELGNLNNLSILDLSGNDLGGNIPAALTEIDSLRFLILSDNNFSGTIPTIFSKMTNLLELYLGNNQYSGSIPAELGQMTSLSLLDLSENQLNGTIPPELANLRDLRYLSLYNNQLTGNIPENLGAMNTEGKYFDFHNNRLTGEIPSSFKNLSNINNIKINNNCLHTSDQELAELMESYDPNWTDTQDKCNEPVQSITLLSPNGGEAWHCYSTQEITWSTTGTVGNLRLSVSGDGGDTWKDISKIIPNTGSYSWEIKWPYISSNCIIRLKQLSGVGLVDHSDRPFSLIAPEGNTITVKSPNGGEHWTAGSKQTITWSSTNLANNVKIEYSVDSGKQWNTIIDNTPNAHSFNLIVPNKISSRCLVRISDAPWGSPVDQSDGEFSIVSASADTITVQSPNGGERWEAGSSRSITWSTTGPIENVKIEFTQDGGSSWTTLKASVSNTGSCNWTVPATQSSRCKVRISDAADGGASDTSDSHFDITANTPPVIELNRESLYFSALTTGTESAPQDLWVSNSGGGILNWTASADVDWITVTPTSGTDKSRITVSVNAAGKTVGQYSGTVTISAPDASNTSETVSVSLDVKNNSQSKEPFGEFSTPQEGASVSGSIPVTGWALDDVGIDHVKIYTEAADGSLLYIGDAIFIEGARPDVEAAFPDFPFNYKAGWGYMLLTNYLPSGGNGQYKLHAVVTDLEGYGVTLGTKTITVDNANASKPFGAIETPTQGGTASGSNFINWGWTLTPQPNSIPSDGSTIDVIVDGVKIGHPVYNLYREDIANMFQGYANSDGAVGYFSLDTTAYENGLHTIQWTVTDSGQNTDGVGSRFFMIENSAANRNSTMKAQATASVLPTIHLDYINIPPQKQGPIRISKGLDDNETSRILVPDNNGLTDLNINELERVVIQLDHESDQGESGNKANYRYTGYLLVSDQLRPLPVGSTLDPDNGIFYWSPGPGFVGTYQLLFIKSIQCSNTNTPEIHLEKRLIRVNIFPGVSR